MPTNINTPLDILKPAIEILMDKINLNNLSSLDHNDFIFSAPVPDSIPYGSYNTRVTITPKASGVHYNSRDIFYKRINITDIVNNREIEILVTTETLLSELIPQINTGYGINLTVDDFVETAIPVLVPGTTHKVILAIKPTSYLFTGVVEVLLGEKLSPVGSDGYTRNFFIVTDSEEPLVFENKLVVLDSDFELSSSYVPMRNTAEITKFRIDRLITLRNNDVYISGEFEFSAALNNNPYGPIVAAALLLSSNGTVKEAHATELFNSDIMDSYSTNNLIDFVYGLDSNEVLGINSNNVYRYTLDGIIDATYSASGLGYTPTMIRVCDDGKIYTVSPEYTAPLASDPGTNGKHIRIDRLTSAGALDATFSTVLIRSTGIVDVTPVMDLLQVSSSGFIVALKPIHGVGTDGPSPIVNDIPFVSGSDPADCSFNPVFKVNQDGTLNTTFSNLLLNNEKSSIALDTTGFIVNQRILSYFNNKVSFLTNRINSLTGYTHRAPISFNNLGTLINLSPSKISSDIRWISVIGVKRLITGKFIIIGSGYSRLPGGGWSTPTALAALYNEESQLDYVIYKPLVAGLAAPQIYSFDLNETLV